jgi:hypothetical protein
MSNENQPEGYLERTHNGTSFSGSDQNIFQSLVIASALRLYAKTGMQANRAYTPTNMLKAASEYTGKKYKRGAYEQAAQDLTAYADALKAAPRKGA